MSKNKYAYTDRIEKAVAEIRSEFSVKAENRGLSKQKLTSDDYTKILDIISTNNVNKDRIFKILQLEH